jgi:chemotaxis protein MotB
VSEKDHPQIVIIKRHARHDDGHHGGAWKIAFADFMTAMMALFLVLWLISSTSDKTKQTVARYFNPVKLVEMTPQQKGFEDPKEADTRPAQQTQASEPEPKAKGAPNPKSKEPSEVKARESQPAGGASRPQQSGPAEPERVLTKDAQDPSPAEGSLRDGVQQSRDETAGAAITAKIVEQLFDDPFSTIRHQLEREAPQDERLVAEDEMQVAGSAGAGPDGDRARAAVPHAKPRGDISRKDGGEPYLAGEAALDKLRSDIIAAVDLGPAAQSGPQIEVLKTDEGLLISLTDQDNYTMFRVGSAEPEKKTVEIIARIAKLVQTRQGMLVIRGHTDGRPYRSATYDNWRLSTARAHIAHDALIQAGLDGSRIEKIEGHADRLLKNAKDPNAPENRRIEILLRKESS